MTDIGTFASSAIVPRSKNRAVGQGELLFSAKDYGAKGDWNGTTGTDDSAAIQAAVTAAAGAPVYLPAGDYRASLSFTNEVIDLRGPGRIIQQPGQKAIVVSRSPGTAKTVTAVSTLQLGQANVFGTEMFSTVALAQSDLQDLGAGDCCLLSSQDAYASDLLLTGNNLKTYTTSWFPVHGIALNVTGLTGAGISEGNTIVGATSGALGPVQGIAVNGTTAVVLLASLTGQFADGEALTVGGATVAAVSGTPVLVMNGSLIDAHATSPKLYKMPRTACRINITVAFSGSINSFVGVANRDIAVQLLGVVDPQVHLEVDGASSRALQLSCCYGGDVYLRTVGRGLPNKAQLAEQGYGYGIELWGATEGTNCQVVAHNVRHAFTTNVYSAVDFASTPLLRSGVPKHWTCHDSVAHSPSAAGFDTHHGSYFGTFDNCTVYGARAGARTATNANGFQNRGWRTTLRNCTAYDCADGFTEYIGSVATHAPVAGRIQYINCRAIRYQRYGFAPAGANAPDRTSIIELIDCCAEGDGRLQNAPFYQSGFVGSTLLAIRWIRCHSAIVNGAHFRISGAYSLHALDCYFDMEGSDFANAAAGFRFDSAPAEASIVGLRYRIDPAHPTSLPGVIRVNGAAVTLSTDGVKQVNGAARPYSQLTSGGTLTTNVITAVTA